jgi:intracellular sulfur oxidation DsrE/DsrF family protein
MGLPLAWARVFLMTNKSVGASESDVTSVMVLRHNGIPLGMESRLWEKYKFGEVFKVDDEATQTPLTANPFWKPKEGSLPLPGMGIDELQKSGVLFGICDIALTVYSKMVADKMKMDAAEVKKDWLSGILPGIQIVPSGVLALNRAQEHGCTYCYAG